MSFKSIVLVALLFVTPAFATEGPSEIVWGGGGCSTQYMFAKISDGSVAVTGTDQEMYDLCFPADIPNGLKSAAPVTDQTCLFPNGLKVTIRDVWYTLLSSMTTAEQCKVGLSSVLGGGEPFAFEDWSVSDFGSGVTILSNCDEILDSDSNGFLEDAGDSCHVSDPVGMVLDTTGTSNVGFKILIDEASSGTPTCTSLGGLKIAMKLEICDAPIE